MYKKNRWLHNITMTHPKQLEMLDGTASWYFGVQCSQKQLPIGTKSILCYCNGIPKMAQFYLGVVWITP